MDRRILSFIIETVVKVLAILFGFIMFLAFILPVIEKFAFFLTST